MPCPSCGERLPLETDSLSAPTYCAQCDSPVLMRLYPAFQRQEAVGVVGKRLVMEDESSCFFHETKRAEAVCDGCGRYLCSLCETPFAKKILCPECLERAEDEGELDELVTKGFRHGSVALLLAFGPILMWPLTCISAPVAIGYSIKCWNKKGSLVHAPKPAFVVASLIAAVQIGLWVFLVLEIANS